MASQDVTELEYEKSLVRCYNISSATSSFRTVIKIIAHALYTQMPLPYTHTLLHLLFSNQMYGQYSELQRFAREYASKSSYRREREKPLTIQEAKQRKSKLWRK